MNNLCRINTKNKINQIKVHLIDEKDVLWVI